MNLTPKLPTLVTAAVAAVLAGCAAGPDFTAARSAARGAVRRSEDGRRDERCESSRSPGAPARAEPGERVVAFLSLGCPRPDRRAGAREQSPADGRAMVARADAGARKCKGRPALAASRRDCGHRASEVWLPVPRAFAETAALHVFLSRRHGELLARLSPASSVAPSNSSVRWRRFSSVRSKRHSSRSRVMR